MITKGVAVILTYRCNSRCSMCYVWKNPSLPNEEISLETLAKIPDKLNTINLTGGEPTLRNDLPEIVDLLYPKTTKLEISSNGLLPQKIEPIIKKYPDIKIRFSLEGFEETNNLIRGEKNGFQTKVNGLLRLKELGGTDLGFATTIQDDNVEDLVELFRFAQKNKFELSTSTLHNGFQFHKNDNNPYDRRNIANYIEQLITEQLKTNNVKNWFRAYLDLGLLAKVLGNERLLPCIAGFDSAFIDPWGDVFACNVRPDLKMGNLNELSWDNIFNGLIAEEVRCKVSQCSQNCWMVGSAKPAMRHPLFRRLPRWTPLIWVINNKLRVLFGNEIDFNRYVAYPVLNGETSVPGRAFYLEQPDKRKIQTREEEHYTQLGEYINQ
jgi:Fe-coproporphyrin III synthase